MAKRNLVYQSHQQSGGLGTAQHIPKFPLLPFERDLIDLLGISEAEYRLFQDEVREKGRLRPAEYDHIPDIQAGSVLVPFLVSLAVGVALTGISMLLAPKPQRPEEAAEVGQQKMADVRGRTRFNQTVDFSALQEVAQLGDRVPILFGRYAETTPPTGGISTAPSLLWSRMLSYGQHQTFRGIYMVGHRTFDDQGIGRPSLAGTLLGNNSLDNLSERTFALYWSSGGSEGSGSDRITATDLIAGTRAEASAGDRFTTNDPFVVPTEEGVKPGFSMAIKPSNQTSFGVHSPIRNGTSIRVNWTAIPFWPDDMDDEGRVQQERKKIAGALSSGRSGGMMGTGRGYSPKMGVVIHNNVFYETITELDAYIGDTIVFLILQNTYTDKLGELGFTAGTGVTGDDIQSTTNSLRQAADDALTEGEIFQIGEALWQVHKRDGIYAPAGESDPSDSYVHLTCIEILNGTSTAKVGIAGRKAVFGWVTDEGGDATATERDFSMGWVGQLFYPLLKSDIAMVRSERQSAVTDIGFATTVYTQLNGLANFPSLPTPQELNRFDAENVQVTAGTQTLYTSRATFFTVHIRPSGLSPEGGKLYDWVPTGKKFGVVGNRPTEQYNFLRFLCTGSPSGKTTDGEFEFRFIGIPMASMVRNTEETDIVDILDAKSSDFYSFSNITAHGYTFQGTYRGSQKAFGEFFPLSEFINKGKKGEFGYVSYVAPGSQLTLGTIYPLWIESGKLAAYWYEVLGDAEENQGVTKTYTAKAYKSVEGGEPDLDGDWVKYEVRATSQRVWWHEEKFNRDYAWVDYTWTVIDSKGDWEVDTPAYAYTSIPVTGNPYTFDWPAPLDGGDSWNGGPLLLVTEVKTNGEMIGEYEGRIFEKYSGVSQLSFYNETNFSSSSNAESRIAYVNQISDNPDGWAHYTDLALVGLVMQSNRQFPSVDQLRMWLPYGVECYRFRTDDEGPSNLFPELAYYLLTSKENGAGTFVNDQLIDKQAFKDSALFCEVNGFTFDGAITEATNLRGYLTQLAPMFLCDFEVINGKFGIRPGLPQTNGTIDPSELPVAGYFSAGNIIDDSFEVTFVPKNDRRDLRMTVIYRQMEREQLPENRTVTVSWKDATDQGGASGLTALSQELDVSSFCTSRAHAVKMARYSLSVRRRIDHTISFKTVPAEFGLSPGNLIVVSVSMTPYSSFCNGAFSPIDGTVSTVNFLGVDSNDEPTNDGTYDLQVYTVGTGTEPLTVTIANNRVTDSTLYGRLFAKVPTIEERRYYKISKIELDEEGLVQVSALFFPTENLKSRIAMDVLDGALFTEVG